MLKRPADVATIAETFTVVQNGGFAEFSVPLELRTKKVNETVKETSVTDEDGNVLTRWKVDGANPGRNRVISFDMTFEFGLLPGSTSFIVTVTTSTDSLYSIRLVFDVIGLAVFDKKANVQKPSSRETAGSSSLTMYTGPQAQRLKIDSSGISKAQSVFYGGDTNVTKRSATFSSSRSIFPWSQKSCRSSNNLSKLKAESCGLGFTNPSFNTLQLRPRKATPSAGEIVEITWNGIAESIVGKEGLPVDMNGNVVDPSVEVTVQVVDLEPASDFPTKASIAAAIGAVAVLFLSCLCCSYAFLKSSRAENGSSFRSASFHIEDDEDFDVLTPSKVARKEEHSTERFSVLSDSSSEGGYSLSSRGSFRGDGDVPVLSKSPSIESKGMMGQSSESSMPGSHRSDNPVHPEAERGDDRFLIGRDAQQPNSSRTRDQPDGFKVSAPGKSETMSDGLTGNAAIGSALFPSSRGRGAIFTAISNNQGYHIPDRIPDIEAGGVFEYPSPPRVQNSHTIAPAEGSTVPRPVLFSPGLLDPEYSFGRREIDNKNRGAKAPSSAYHLVDGKPPFESSEFNNRLGLGSEETDQAALDFALAPVRLREEEPLSSRSSEMARAPQGMKGDSARSSNPKNLGSASNVPTESEQIGTMPLSNSSGSLSRDSFSHVSETYIEEPAWPLGSTLQGIVEPTPPPRPSHSDDDEQDHNSRWETREATSLPGRYGIYTQDPASPNLNSDQSNPDLNCYETATGHTPKADDGVAVPTKALSSETAKLPVRRDSSSQVIPGYGAWHLPRGFRGGRQEMPRPVSSESIAVPTSSAFRFGDRRDRGRAEPKREQSQRPARNATLLSSRAGSDSFGSEEYDRDDDTLDRSFGLQSIGSVSDRQLRDGGPRLYSIGSSERGVR